MSAEKTTTDPAVKLLGWLALFPVHLLLEGISLRLMWLWFCEPLGLPRIGVAHTLGLAVMLSLVVMRVPSNSDEASEQNPIYRECAAISGCLFALLIAWGLHAVMVS